MMYKFVSKIAFYGLALLLVLQIISYLSLCFLSQSCFYKQQFVKNGFNRTEFDYVVLGSSTGLTTLDTKLIDTLTGKNGLNISMDDSSLSSHYLMLQHFYSCGHTTKTLVLAIMPDDVSNPSPRLNENDYRFLPHIETEPVYNYFKELDTDVISKYTASRYFPLIGVSYFNTELFFPSIVSVFQPTMRNRFDERGNYSYPDDVTDLKLSNKLTVKKPIFTNPFHGKIVSFCKQHSIELILYQSPLYKTRCDYSDIFKVINHSDLVQNSDLFYDRLHVNAKGRIYCSEIFARQFK